MKYKLLTALMIISLIISACGPQAELDRGHQDYAITEDDIETATPDLRESMQTVVQYVRANWRQVEHIFVQKSETEDMSGKLTITLFFDLEGGVEEVIIEPEPGSNFTENFLTEAEDIMMEWHIPTVEDLMPFRFTRELEAN